MSLQEYLTENNLSISKIIEHSISKEIEIFFNEVIEEAKTKKDLMEFFNSFDEYEISLQFPNVESSTRLDDSDMTETPPFDLDDSETKVEEFNELLASQRQDLGLEDITKNDLKNVNVNISEEDFNLDTWKEEKLQEFRDSIPDKTAVKEEVSYKLKPGQMVMGRKSKAEPVLLNDLNFNDQRSEKNICVEGDIFSLKIPENSNFYNVYITDNITSLNIQLYIKEDNEKLKNKVEENLKPGNRIKVFGNIEFNEYQNDKVMKPRSIELLEPKGREDTSEQKRVEFHAHSQYSTLDGISKVGELIDLAESFGFPALAVTDHGVIQAFPEFQRLSKGKNLKIIYGVEAYMVDTSTQITIGTKNQSLDDEFVFFDLETTGTSIYDDKVIEIAAVRVKEGEIVDEYQTYINPGRNVPAKITELTGITNKDVRSGISEDEGFSQLLDFIGDSVIAAHNATFDVGFLKRWLNEKDMEFTLTYIDSLPLARATVPEVARYNMGRLCSFFKIKNKRAHRAIYDSIASAQVLLKLFERAGERGCKTVQELNNLIDLQMMAKKNGHTNHVTIYAKNQRGLFDLYKLISDSHLLYFNNYPRVPKEILRECRENLIIGSACSKGELYEALLDNAPDEVLDEIVKFYDFLEVQPISNYEYLTSNNQKLNKSALEKITKRIIDIGKKNGKLVLATGDSHFNNPHDYIFRDIIKSTSKKSIRNRAPLYFRTTDEMLEEFDYLDPKTRKEIVIDNTLKLNELFEEVKPVPDGTYPPIIEGAAEELKNSSIKRAHEIYGETLPEFVQKRLDRELDSIIGNDYSVLYIIAQKLVKHSEEEGFIVGSRGSVGSSLVAYLCGITEVNSLPAHYNCPKCHYTELIDQKGLIGKDLDDKVCPKCGTPLNKEGFDIPFETFLGFEGDKEPDIDLNFSGLNQSEAHRYTEEIFGEGKTFRAGTISTIQEATAFGYVKNYFDSLNKEVHPAEIERLKLGCTGIKRTTGQHPGGIIVVPRDREIYQFTPVQHPADDPNTDVITTHFDYHSISGRLFKLDILGHDDPTMLYNLEKLTGVNPREIPLDSREVIDLFTGVEPLKFIHECDIELGNNGIPEFGTPFVRQMIKDLKPKSFTDLIRISGLSHGTMVWKENAQDLLKDGISKDDIITTRDDIMLSLLKRGMKPIDSFTIMEHVRKGKGLSDEELSKMREQKVEEWFIQSCMKIKYLFPKAHAAAYVIMAFRIAWYKIHYPLEYYSCYFGIRSKEFDLKVISSGIDAVKEEIFKLENEAFNELTNKDKESLTSLEVALELYARGFRVKGVDLQKSHYNKFIIEGDALIPPFNTINGMGDTAAESLYNAIHNEEILSQQDLLNKSKITKTNLNSLKELGCLDGIPENNQVTFF